jgi:hypothetical protein
MNGEPHQWYNGLHAQLRFAGSLLSMQYAEHAVIRSKGKDWWTQKQDNSE